MAVVSSTLVSRDLRSQYNDVHFVHQWSLGSTDVGTPIELVDYADRTVDAYGTFDSATLVIEGSLDGVQYHTLTDQIGNPLSWTAADLSSVMEAVVYIRPSTSGGLGSTSITVNLLLRREVV